MYFKKSRLRLVALTYCKPCENSSAFVTWCPFCKNSCSFLLVGFTNIISTVSVTNIGTPFCSNHQFSRKKHQNLKESLDLFGLHFIYLHSKLTNWLSVIIFRSADSLSAFYLKLKSLLSAQHPETWRFKTLKLGT